MGVDSYRGGVCVWSISNRLHMDYRREGKGGGGGGGYDQAVVPLVQKSSHLSWTSCKQAL